MGRAMARARTRGPMAGATSVFLFFLLTFTGISILPAMQKLKLGTVATRASFPPKSVPHQRKNGAWGPSTRGKILKVAALREMGLELVGAVGATPAPFALASVAAAYLSATPGVGSAIVDNLVLRPIQGLDSARRGLPTKECLIIGNKVGAGNFGDVFEAVWTKKDPNTKRIAGVDPGNIKERLVVKRVKMQEDGAKRLGEVESYMNRRLSRAAPGISAPFIGSITTDEFGESQLWLLWKFDGIGTLKDYMSERDFPLNLEKVLFKRETKGTKEERSLRIIKEITKQILTNIKKMHAAGIVHRDIKPDNLLITESGRVKLLDLGAAVDLRSGYNYIPDEAILDPSFAPPERYVMPESTPKPPGALLSSALSPFLWAYNQPDKFDTYSAGVILAQMAVPGIRTMDPKQFARTLVSFEQDLADWRLRAAGSLGWDLLDANDAAGFKLLSKLMDPDRKARVTASQALSSPFFTNFAIPSIELPSLAVAGAKQTLQSGSAVVKKTTKGITFAPGEKVKYKSQSVSEWVDAEVLRINADGTVDLDVKNRASIDRIRKMQSRLDYSEGEKVEYKSQTNSGWISAEVLRVNSDGSIDLDVKPRARPDRVRRPSKFKFF